MRSLGVHPARDGTKKQKKSINPLKIELLKYLDGITKSCERCTDFVRKSVCVRVIPLSRLSVDYNFGAVCVNCVHCFAFCTRSLDVQKLVVPRLSGAIILSPEVSIMHPHTSNEWPVMTEQSIQLVQSQNKLINLCKEGVKHHTMKTC
jgi:hypothetical protein